MGVEVEFPGVWRGGDGTLHADDPDLALALSPLIRRMGGGGDCVLPLDGAHWLVGRRAEPGTVWRVSTREGAPHPALLWVVPALWEPTSLAEAPPPVWPTLASLRSVPGPWGALPAVIEALRGRRGPLALLTKGTEEPSFSRAFLLALLRLVPGALGDRLWICAWDPRPRPDAWDLVITDTPPGGVTLIDLHAPPALTDPVARWARYLLEIGDETGLAKLPTLWREGAADPWAAGLRDALLRGRAGGPRVHAELLRADPEAAVEALTAWFEAGASLDGAPLVALASVTARTSDPRPWRALAGRPGESVGKALRAWVALPHRAPLRRDLTEAIFAARPDGPGLEAVLSELLEWLDAHPTADGLQAWSDLFSRVSLSLETPTLATLGGEWLRIQRATLTPEVFWEVLGSPLARRSAWGVLLSAWLALPASVGGAALARPLFKAMASDPEAHRVAAEALESWMRLGEWPVAEGVVEAWVEVVARGEVRSSAAVVRALRGTPLVRVWAAEVSRHLRGADLRSALAATQEPRVWRWALEQRTRDWPTGKRLAAVFDLLPEGAAYLEKPARALLREGMNDAPIEALHALAQAFHGLPEAAPLWTQLALVTAPAGSLDDEMLDGSALAWCAGGSADLDLDAALVRLLVEGEGTDPLDLARWIVRFTMAERVGEPPLSWVLALELLRAAAAQDPKRAGVLVGHILDLPLGHPALDITIEQFIPRIWGGPFPCEFAAALRDLTPEVEARLTRWMPPC